MAFPVIQAVGETNGSTAATSKVCNLPTGIVSGDLLLLELRSNGADTHSTPTDWTALFLNDGSDISDDVTSLWYRVAAGTEGASVTVTATASLKFTSVSFRVSGHDSATAPVISTLVVGTSASPDPPALTPAGGAKDFLWLAMAAYEGEQTDPPTFPTNYTLGQVAASSGAGGAIATNSRSAGAGSQLNAATEDPGIYTISVSDDWTAWTVAIYPTPPAPSANPVFECRVPGYA